MKNKIAFIFFIPIALGMTTQANAADGCKFMLCMGAPNPMGIAECASTVKEVLRDLKKGKGFPKCKLANGLDSNSSGSYVTPNRASITPHCPEGTTQGQDGVIYHMGKPPRHVYSEAYKQGFANVISTEDVWRSKDDAYSRRICVSGQHYATQPTYQYGDESIPEQQWWQNIQIMNPDGATYQFNFFIDNKLYSSHRF